jgi:hypothetical protein
LYVADNKLVYFPHCLSLKLFHELDISNNLIPDRVTPNDDHLFKYLMVLKSIQNKKLDEISLTSLSHLALYNLMDNCVPFKRQDIPRTLWIYFNLMGCCISCKRRILPDYCKIGFSPTILRLIENQNYHIPGQFMICRKNCYHESKN